MTVELIRHGETVLQAEHRYQGSTDAPLSPEGCQKLRTAGYVPDRLCVTEMKRTAQTAEILFPNVPQIVTKGMEEMNFGLFEGRNYTEMEHDPVYRLWVEGGCLGQCPGGESKEEFCRRACSAFSRLVEQALRDGIEILTIVAHGGTQMAVMERFCTEKRNYFDWHADSGEGFLLDVSGWPENKTVTLVKRTNYKLE